MHFAILQFTQGRRQRKKPAQWRGTAIHSLLNNGYAFKQIAMSFIIKAVKTWDK